MAVESMAESMAESIAESMAESIAGSIAESVGEGSASVPQMLGTDVGFNVSAQPAVAQPDSGEESYSSFGDTDAEESVVEPALAASPPAPVAGWQLKAEGAESAVGEELSMDESIAEEIPFEN
jgi:hypothetical protein